MTIEGITKIANGQVLMEDNRELLRSLEQSINSNTQATVKLIEVVDIRMRGLIDMMAGRGMIPIESLKWVIIFVLLYTFAKDFGIESFVKVVQIFKE